MILTQIKSWLNLQVYGGLGLPLIYFKRKFVKKPNKSILN